MDLYCKQVMRVVVAQICTSVGWQAIKEFPLELLSDVLDRFLKEFTRELSKFVEFCGRTEPNLEDVALVVDQMSINLHELFEFIKNVDPVPCVIAAPKLPTEKPNSLNILRSGDSEMIQRPSHFHEHFPSINIVTNGEDNIKSESEETENMPEARTQHMNTSFKLPAMFPKEEQFLSHRNNDDENKSISSGNNAVQMDKFGNIRVFGSSGKKASTKPPVFNPLPIKSSIKPESAQIIETVKTSPSAIEKNIVIENPKTPPTSKKIPSLTPIEFNIPVSLNRADVLSAKKDKKEKKKKKLFLLHEKQKRKQMKQMQKAIALEKDSLNEKSNSAPEKAVLQIPDIATPYVSVDEASIKLPDAPVKQIESDTTNKLDTDLPLIETKSISVTTVPTDTPQKITSEPDKNKLNIFKKIPVKKDIYPQPITTSFPIIDVDESPIDNFNLQYGTTITPAPSIEPIVTKTISPSKQRDIKDHVNLKDLGGLKNKEHAYGKLKEKNIELLFPKTKDSTMQHTENIKKDDAMSSFAARAMMSIISGSKSQEGPSFHKLQQKKRKAKLLDRINDDSKLFNEPLNLANSFANIAPPMASHKILQDSNIIDLSVEPVQEKKEKPTSITSQSESQDLTAINKKLMKMDTVMKPTFPNSIVTPIQHQFLPSKFTNMFNFPSMGSDLQSAFQNMHVPMFGFQVPPLLPPPPVIMQSTNINTGQINQKVSSSLVLNEPIEVSSDESTRGGEDMEIEPPSVQEIPPKEDSPEKSPSSPDKKKKTHKKHKKNKNKGNEEKIEKNRKRKRKNKEITEETFESQKDKKKKDKKKEKKDKKGKSEDDITITVTPPTNVEARSDLFGSPIHMSPVESTKRSETGSPIPKLTLKIGSLSGSSEKINLDERPLDETEKSETLRIEGNSSPELAKISALITHAPKQKAIGSVSPSSQSTCLTPIITAMPFLESFKSPLNISTTNTSVTSEINSDVLFLSPKSEKILTNPTVCPNVQSTQKTSTSTCLAPTTPTAPIESNRPSSYIDEEGNEVWICPACGRVDDGTPMIGCDGCDAWYHWICVGIKEPPNKSDDWFCRVCILKNREEQFNFPSGERKKKSKKSKKSSKCMD